MKVYVVTVTAPNGNSMSRPIVAETAAQAEDQYAAEHHLPELSTARKQGFKIESREASDPDGSYIRALQDAERRRLENERWK